ncbi:MAG: single-stranded-DNA-specific exonuclease RecJ [Oscillospiraceae bacterium]|nr:single-stranded-DNA-specific exonuclease RecJ [Oscillospiraceae bacterium]
MYFNKWILKNNDVDDINNNYNKYSKILKKVLKNKGLITQTQIDDFINYNNIYQDPFKLKDMEKAVCRIKEALENNEKIIIYGDYDVDGMTSTVVLYLYLCDLGADVYYYIPSREKEGYGLNVKSIDKLSKDCQLIITVDNGITAVEEIDYARSLGIDVIVTDHHKPLEILPNAVAVIDPHRKDCESGCGFLSGVGVVFKLVSALEGDYKAILDKYADIICLGTVADVMPVVGENRLIVKAGLEKMKSNPNLGIKALIEASRININNISANMISYRLAPRLNSASRMGIIWIAMDLLLSNSEIEAQKLAKELDNINEERKKIESQMMSEINQIILEDPSLLTSEIIIISKEGWNHSISGINASKLTERYNKPCILISTEEDEANASGRSIEGFSLIKAVDFCKDYLIKYGGHDLAAGFTLKTKNIDEFSKKINQYISSLEIEMSIKKYYIDCEIDSSDVTIDNIQDLRLLEPYGFGNEMPIIMIKNARIKNLIALSGGKYTKIVVEFKNKSILELLDFNKSWDDFLYKIDDNVDVLVNLELNEYNNIISPMLLLKDIRKSDFDQDEFFYQIIEYNKFKNSKQFDKELFKNNIPSRSEVVLVYKYLKTVRQFTYVTIDELIEYLFIKLENLNYIKIGLILKILEDIKVIILNNKIEFLYLKQKADIKTSKTYQFLCNI